MSQFGSGCLRSKMAFSVGFFGAAATGIILGFRPKGPDLLRFFFGPLDPFPRLRMRLTLVPAHYREASRAACQCMAYQMYGNSTEKV